MSLQPASARAASRRVARREPPPLERGTAVRETTELMAVVLDSYPGYVALLDVEGNIFATNNGWTELHREYGLESIACAALGDNYVEMLQKAAESGHEHASCILDALNEIQGDSSRTRVERTCGSSDQKLLAFVAAPLHRPMGGIVVTAVDVTSWATSARALQNAQRDLMKAAQLAVAGELIGGITHDLRQPLTSLQMNLETVDFLLRQPSASPSSTSGVMADAIVDAQRVRDSIQVLQDLVTRREPHLVSVALGSVVAEVVRLLQSEALARHVVLERSVFGAELEITADPTMLHEAVLSLLLDAIENSDTNPGAARVSIATRAVDGAKVALEVSYQRRQRSSNNEGWGLSVVRSVADAHGAFISIEETADLSVVVTTTWPTERDRFAYSM
jgi:signal transduction histidine kinase